MAQGTKILWVFGYGSLMWRPGFPFEVRRRARLHGYHRSLCVYSHVHRGTPDRPGLVMGLDRGGSCEGVAFGVAPERWDEVIAYLRSREQVTMVYRELRAMIRFKDSGELAEAVTYAVDRSHGQYAGKLTLEEQARFIVQGHGQSGACRDYVLNTAEHLREMNIQDGTLESLASLLQAASPTG
jgi:glutathione-specific gamma-glutamylcyclotransferase